MSLYALDALDDAIDATRRFLLPVDRVRWLRLAVVMFFVTAGGVSFQVPAIPNWTFGGEGPTVGGPTDGAVNGPDITPEVTPELVALAIGLVVLVAALALAWAVVGAVMEFVFVGSLREEEVRLVGLFREHVGQGLRLFAFRFVVWLVGLALVAGPALAVGLSAGGWPPTGWSDATAVSVLLVAVPLAALAALVFGTLLGFTTVFVVPVMLAEDRGVVGAWRRFWPTLIGEWKQFLVYAVAAFLLGIGVSIATSLVLVAIAIGLAIPVLLVTVPLALLAGVNAITGGVILVLAILYVVAVLVSLLIVQVPFQTFLRYYALFVLGDANDAFDVIPEARRAVRDGDGTASGGAGAVPTEDT
jgi:MFS family permease